MEVGEDLDFIAVAFQGMRSGERYADRISDAVDIDDNLRWRPFDYCSLEKCNHCLRLEETRWGCAATNDFQFVYDFFGVRMRWRWQTATASASVTSNRVEPFFIARMEWIMYCTCCFEAAPLPTSAFFTSRGEYSDIGTLFVIAASIATPRAWPSFNADCAFLP